MFANSARNPDIVREFLKLSKAGTSRCFIATAAFADAQHPVVLELRRFRDERLYSSPLGFRFVLLYNEHSPSLARIIERHRFLAPPARAVLKILATMTRDLF
jgi:hypothetical protein